MGIFDKAKDALSGHSDKVDAAIDKAADVLDQRTGGQHGPHIDRGADLAKDRMRDYLGSDPEPVAPAAPADPTVPGEPVTPPAPRDPA